MKRLLPLLLAGCLTNTLAHARPVVLDSLGMERKEGKLYILHRVEQGQTLYSLVRKYGSSVQSIKEANPGMPDNVRYAQVVRVPVANLSRREEKVLTKAVKKEEKEQKREAEAVRKEDVKAANSGIHQVEPGQTLYSLASRYGVSMDDVRKWNNLTSDHIVSGQALIVSEKAWRVREPAIKPTIPLAKPDVARPDVARPNAAKPARADSPKTERPAPPRTLPAKTERSAESEEASRPTDDRSATDRRENSESTPSEPRVIRPGDTGPLPNPGANARQISEVGLAEVIDESDNSNKYLALHRTAPVGTLVLVRNDLNNQSIWVKVIGRLPATSINEKVIVKISARAFEKLSPADRRFRAEVSYLAP